MKLKRKQYALENSVEGYANCVCLLSVCSGCTCTCTTCDCSGVGTSYNTYSSAYQKGTVSGTSSKKESHEGSTVASAGI